MLKVDPRYPKVIATTIDAETKDELKKLAQEYKISVCDVLRRIIKEHLEQGDRDYG